MLHISRKIHEHCSVVKFLNAISFFEILISDVILKVLGLLIVVCSAYFRVRNGYTAYYTLMFD